MAEADNVKTFMLQWEDALGDEADTLKPSNDQEWLALLQLEKRRVGSGDKSKKDVLAMILEREYAKYLREHPKQARIKRRAWLDRVTGMDDGRDQRARWFFTRMMSPEYPFCKNYGLKSGYYAIDVASDLKSFGTKKTPTIYNYICRFKNGEYRDAFGEESDSDEEVETPRKKSQPQTQDDNTTEEPPHKKTKVATTPRRMHSERTVSDEEEEEVQELVTIDESTLQGFMTKSVPKSDMKTLQETVATLQETVNTMENIMSKKLLSMAKIISTLRENELNTRRVLNDIILKTNRRFLNVEEFLKKT